MLNICNKPRISARCLNLFSQVTSDKNDHKIHTTSHTSDIAGGIILAVEQTCQAHHSASLQVCFKAANPSSAGSTAMAAQSCPGSPLSGFALPDLHAAPYQQQLVLTYTVNWSWSCLPKGMCLMAAAITWVCNKMLNMLLFQVQKIL